MKRRTICLLVIFSLFFFFNANNELLGAPYFEGKVIKLIVGVPPGGGYDRMARTLARHLPRHIPGQPVIITGNMPGASTMIAANYIYNIAKPDGLRIATVFNSLCVAQLMKVKGHKFDLRKISWVGGTGPEAYLIAVRTDLPHKNFEDLIKSKYELIVGSTGAADATSVFPNLLKAYAGLKLKIAIYPGSADILLAVERKEVDGRAGSYGSLLPFIDRGLVRPLIRSRVSQPGVENLDVDENFATSKMGATIMRMYSSGRQIGRLYMAPPKTPDKVMGILRKAFADVGKDPAFMKDIKKNRLVYNYASADDILKVVNFVLNQPDNIVEEFGRRVKF
jgi:tripartite-type tricarboxylate transporter receptor subunit TctC